MVRYTIEQGPITVNYGTDTVSNVFLAVTDSRLHYDENATKQVNNVTSQVGIKDGGGSYFDIHTGKDGFGERVDNKTMATFLRRYGVTDEHFLSVLEDTSTTSRMCIQCQSPATEACGGCSSVSYCGRECQKAHWKTHKAHCKFLKQARTSNQSAASQQAESSVKLSLTEMFEFAVKLIKTQDFASFKKLIEDNPSLVNRSSESHGNTTLLFPCILANQIRFVKVLLDNKADVNVMGMNGENFLLQLAGDNTIEASNNNSQEIFRMVLDNGHTDINLRNSFGDTTLSHVSSHGGKEAVILLLERGADVNIKSNDGQTALSSASAGGYIDIVRLLLSAGADATIVADNGGTALRLARQNRHGDIVALLEHNLSHL